MSSSPEVEPGGVVVKLRGLPLKTRPEDVISFFGTVAGLELPGVGAVTIFSKERRTTAEVSASQARG